MPCRKISASLEDYLEAIYHISKAKQVARARDIAKRVGVRASSVTGALRHLTERGLINYSPYEVITLTKDGIRCAEDVIERHKTLHALFGDILGLDAERADDAACRAEHALDPDIHKRLATFVGFMRNRPDIIEAFRAHLLE